MQNAGARKPATDQTKKPSPRQGTTLTSSPKGTKPMSKDLTAEGVQTIHGWAIPPLEHTCHAYRRAVDETVMRLHAVETDLRALLTLEVGRPLGRTGA